LIHGDGQAAASRAARGFVGGAYAVGHRTGAERGIAWRLADSLALRRFVGIALDEDTPDHSTISRTRRLIDLDMESKRKHNSMVVRRALGKE